MGAGLSVAFAQQATAPDATAKPAGQYKADDEVLQLSPFSVDARDDRGYQAESSLSGSRLRSSLRDMGTPVTAFTEQFLLDTAITNTDELVKYMVNANYDLNEEANGQNGQITSAGQPVKMRGLGGNDVTINFFKIGTRTDTFSTERIEQARGPNAILFGIGSAGGIVNVTTKRAKLNANSGSIGAAVRSFDGNRLEGDYNQVIIPGKLAVRLAAVTTDTGSWRNHTFNNSNRTFGTLKYQPTPKMEINLEFETADLKRAVKRTYTALDAYTVWRDAGSNLSPTANASLGVATLGANPYMVFDSDAGTLMNWRNKMKTANVPNVGGLVRVLTDFSVLPRETSITGPGFDQTQDYTRLMGFFNYALTKEWNIEVAAARYNEEFTFVDNQQGFEQYLYADPNATLPNGAANPNAGRAYLESNPIIVNRDNRSDRVRAVMSYRHDYGWLGTHTFAAVAEYGWNFGTAMQYREYIVSPNAPSTVAPENANNRVFRRTYVNLNGPSERIVMANPFAASPSGLTDPVSGNVYQTAFIPFGAGSQMTETKLFSTIGMIQSAFWKNRIHTVVGMSRDQRNVTRSTQDRVALPGFTNGLIRTLRGHDGVDDPRTTNYSFSGVYHVTNWVSLTYSQAQNSDVPNNTVVIMYGPDGLAQTRFKAAKGKSQDVGLRFDLFDNRVSANILYYQTSAAGDNEFSLGVTNADMNNIWGALNRDGVIDPNTGQVAAAAPEASTAQTYDQRSQGYELSLTANLTPNWRVLVNASRSIATRAHIGPEMVAHLDAVRPLWQANAGRALATPSGSLQTIGDMITQIDRQATTSYIVADGRRPIGQLPFKLAGRTNYDFTTGAFKGFGVGAAVRYTSKPVIGYIPGSVDSSGNLVPFQYYYGSDQIFFDASVSYRRRVKLFDKSVMWSVQLNVDNLLDNDAFVRMRVDATGALQNYRFNEPRQWILSTRLAF